MLIYGHNLPLSGLHHMFSLLLLIHHSRIKSSLNPLSTVLYLLTFPGLIQGHWRGVRLLWKLLEWALSPHNACLTMFSMKWIFSRECSAEDCSLAIQPSHKPAYRSCPVDSSCMVVNLLALLFRQLFAIFQVKRRLPSGMVQITNWKVAGHMDHQTQQSWEMEGCHQWKQLHICQLRNENIKTGTIETILPNIPDHRKSLYLDTEPNLTKIIDL